MKAQSAESHHSYQLNRSSTYMGHWVDYGPTNDPKSDPWYVKAMRAIAGHRSLVKKPSEMQGKPVVTIDEFRRAAGFKNPYV